MSDQPDSNMNEIEIFQNDNQPTQPNAEQSQRTTFVVCDASKSSVLQQIDQNQNIQQQQRQSLTNIPDPNMLPVTGQENIEENIFEEYGNQEQEIQYNQQQMEIESAMETVPDLLDVCEMQLEQNDGQLDESLLQLVKDRLENPPSQQMTNYQPKFCERALRMFNKILKQEPQFSENRQQKIRNQTLEIISKGLLATVPFDKHISELFQLILHLLEKDNEQNGIVATRILIELIKTFNNKLDFATNYLPLFNFLSSRTKFLLEITPEDLELNSGTPYLAFNQALSNSQNQNQNQNVSAATIIKADKSIKLLIEIPNIYIYTLNYVDTGDDKKVTQSLKESINNIIQAIKNTAYAELQRRLSKAINAELYNVMIKMVQFISIILRKDIRNEKYVKHAQEQLQFIDPKAISEAVLNLLKNCPEDSSAQRIEIINSLKVLIKNIGREKFKEVNEMLNEEVIFGKSKFQSIYAKNSIYSNWIDILTQLQNPSMPINDQSKIFEVLLKNIFDNNLYQSIQHQSLKLLKTMVEEMIQQKISNKEHYHKHLAIKILHKIALKFGQIKENFDEIIQYIKRRFNNVAPKAQCKTLFNSSMPSKQVNQSQEEWDQKRIAYIQTSGEIDIDSNLLTYTTSQYNTLHIYEDDEEFIINCLIINQNTYLDYFKENKDLMINLLIEVTKCLLLYLTKYHSIQNASLNSLNANGSLNSIQQQQQQRMLQLQSAPYSQKLDETECSIFSLLFKNGLKVFDHFHSLKLHFEDKNREQPFRSFMGIFASISDTANFKDIIEKNMETIFYYLLKYSNECFETCLQNFLILPFYNPPPPNLVHNQQSQASNSGLSSQTWKNFTEILIRFLLNKIEVTPEILTECDPFYEFKHDFHSLLQKLIKIPMKCLCKYNDDTFIRPYFRQFILCLIKKTHTQRYPLEYLNLLKQLFKNILLYHKYEYLSNEFQYICVKNVNLNSSPQGQISNPSVSNVNVIENFIALYNTGIKEVKEIVTELMVILPLKSKHLIQMSKQKYIIHILINSLTLNDTNLLVRSIKLFDMIFTTLNHKEVQTFLQGAHEELLHNLFAIMREFRHSKEVDPQRAHAQHVVIYVARVLGKLGHIPRTARLLLNVQVADQADPDYELIHVAEVKEENARDIYLRIISKQWFHQIINETTQRSYQDIDNCEEHIKKVLQDGKRLIKQCPVLDLDVKQAVLAANMVIKQFMDNKPVILQGLKMASIELAYNMLHKMLLTIYNLQIQEHEQQQQQNDSNISNTSQSQLKMKSEKLESFEKKFETQLRIFVSDSDTVLEKESVCFYEPKWKVRVEERIQQDIQCHLDTLNTQQFPQLTQNTLTQKEAFLEDSSDLKYTADENYNSVTYEVIKGLVQFLFLNQANYFLSIRDDILMYFTHLARLTVYIYLYQCKLQDQQGSNVNDESSQTQAHLHAMKLIPYNLRVFVNCAIQNMTSKVFIIRGENSGVENYPNRIVQEMAICINHAYAQDQSLKQHYRSNFFAYVLHQLNLLGQQSNLNKKQAFVLSLHALFQQVQTNNECIYPMAFNLLNTVFDSMNEITDCITLETCDYLDALSQRLTEVICWHARQNVDRHELYSLVALFTQNLITYKERTHCTAKRLIKYVADYLNFSVTEMLVQQCPLSNQAFELHLNQQKRNLNPKNAQMQKNVLKQLETHLDPHNQSQLGIGIQELLQTYPSLFISGILDKIGVALAELSILMRSDDTAKLQYFRYISEDRLKYLANVFNTLSFLLIQPIVPFQIINMVVNDANVNNVPPSSENYNQNQYPPEVNWEYDPNFFRWLETCHFVVQQNQLINRNLNYFASIIVEAPPQPNANIQKQGIPPNQPLQAQQLAQQQQQQQYQPIGQPSQSQQGPTQQQGQQGEPQPQPLPQLQPQQSQPSQQINNQINSNTYLEDLEYNLNIDDIDMTLQTWSKCIVACMHFQKQTLMLDLVNKTARAQNSVLSKLQQRNKNDMQSQNQNTVLPHFQILNSRVVILDQYFEMIVRIEKRIRKGVYQCLKQLISMETSPKDLIQTDDKMKKILRPVLICLQQDFKNFTPSFLQVLKKLLKLLQTCFNKAMNDKLLDHLKQRADQASIYMNQLQQQMQGDGGSGSSHIRAAQPTLNDFKCVSGLVGLFEHLSYQYHSTSMTSNQNNQSINMNSGELPSHLQIQQQQASSTSLQLQSVSSSIAKSYSLECLEIIVNGSIKIEKQLVSQFGKSYLSLLRLPLTRFVNKQALVFIDFFLKNDNLKDTKQNSQLFFDILKQNEAVLLREKLSREISQQPHKFIFNYNKPTSQQQQNIGVQSIQSQNTTGLRIIHILSKKNPRLLLNNPNIVKHFSEQLFRFPLQEEEFLNYDIKSEQVLILKIMVAFCKQKHDSPSLIFHMLGVLNTRRSLDFSFLLKFYRYFIPSQYSPVDQSHIFDYFLTILQDPSVPIETKVAASYEIIYPMLQKASFNTSDFSTQMNKVDINKQQQINNDISKMQHSRATLQQIVTKPILERFTSMLSELKAKEASKYTHLDVEVLQITSLLMKSLKEDFRNTHVKIVVISFCWNLLKSDDKILRNIAYIFACKFIVTFGLPEEKVIQIYISLLKSQEYMNQHDNDIKILSRKALDILIPFLPNIKPNSVSSSSSLQIAAQPVQIIQNQVQTPTTTTNPDTNKLKNDINMNIMKDEDEEGQQTSSAQQHQQQTTTSTTIQQQDPQWIAWTYRIFNEESCVLANNFALGRFWHIFIKNHQVYYEYRKAFNTQMINSMQYIFVSSNSNVTYKKIASDLSFIYIEWQYREHRENLLQLPTEQLKLQYLHAIRNDECPEIFLNFFIKLSMHNCTEKEDKEVIKRSLYLLQKIFIIWPNTKIRIETIKRQCQSLVKNEQQQQQQSPLDTTKFCYTLLTILNILLDFDLPSNIQLHLDMIFYLLKFQGLPNCFINDNPYLIKIVISIIKKLLRHKLQKQTFIEKLKSLMSDGLNSYIQALRGQTQVAQQQLHGQHGRPPPQNMYQPGQGPSPQAMQNQPRANRVGNPNQMNPNQNLAQNQPQQPQINIYITIKILHLLFELNHDNAQADLVSIKDVTKIFVDLFQRRDIINSFKGKGCDDVQDLLLNLDEPFTDENYEQLKFNYLNLREFLVILLRILATKINSFKNKVDKLAIIESIFLNILENIHDHKLKVEIIQLLSCLFLYHYTPLPFHQKVQRAEFTDLHIFFERSRIQRFIKSFQKSHEKSLEEKAQQNMTQCEMRIIKHYIVFLTRIIQQHTSQQHLNQTVPNNASQPISLIQLRDIILIMSRYNTFFHNKILFEVLENKLGNSLRQKIMFIFGEFHGNDKERFLQMQNGEDSEVLCFAIQYLMYHISKQTYFHLQTGVIHSNSNIISRIAIFKSKTNQNQSNSHESNSLQAYTNIFVKVPVVQLIDTYMDLISSDTVITSSLAVYTFGRLYQHALHTTESQSDVQAIALTVNNYLTNTSISCKFAEVLLLSQLCLSPTPIPHMHDLQLKFVRETICAEELQYIAKRLNCWHVAQFALEQQLYVEGAVSCINADGKINSLFEILSKLGESDYLYGLKRTMATNPLLLRGLSYLQLRDYPTAYHVFSQLFLSAKQRKDLSSSSQVIENNNNVNELSDENDLLLNQTFPETNYLALVDKSILESGMTDLLMNLNQWEPLYDMASANNNHQLKLECCWQMKRFDVLREYIRDNQQDPSSFNSLAAAMIKLRDAQNMTKEALATVEFSTIAHGFVNAIYEWQVLPEILSSWNILLRFQCLVEAEESIMIISKLKDDMAHLLSQGQGHDALEITIHEVVRHIDNWRERLPGPQEDMTTWKTIVEQRVHFYKIFKNKLSGMLASFLNQDSQEGKERKLNSLHDIAWHRLKYINAESSDFGVQGGILQFVKDTDQQGLHPLEQYLQAKLLVLHHMENTPNNSNEIEKIVEHCTSNDGLSSEQKAELFRLKALSSMHQGDIEQAYTDFMQCFSHCEMFSKAWFNWQTFSLRNYIHNRTFSWCLEAIQAMAHTCKYKPAKTKMYLCDLFWFVSQEEDNAENMALIQSTIKKYILQDMRIPLFNWAMYIPNLLSYLLRQKPLAQIAQAILSHFCLKNPSILYFSLKGFEQSQSQSICPPNQSLMQIQTEHYDTSCLNKLKQEMLERHGLLIRQMDMFYAKCTHSYQTPTELALEQLYNKMCFVIDSIYAITSEESKYFIVQYIKDHLFTSMLSQETFPIIKIFLQERKFNFEELQDGQNILALCEIFISIRDFLLTQLTFACQFAPTTHALLLSLNNEIEIPSLTHNSIREPIPETVVRIKSLLPSLQLVRRGNKLLRRLTLVGTNSKDYHYTALDASNFSAELHYSQASPESLQAYDSRKENNPLSALFTDQFIELINSQCNFGREASARNLSIDHLKLFQIGQFQWLQEDGQKLVVLGDAFDNHLQQMNFDFAAVLKMFDYYQSPPQNTQNIQNMQPTSLKEHMRKQGKLINAHMFGAVNSQILQKFVLQNTSNYEEYFALRKQFTYSYAMSNFFSFIVSNRIRPADMAFDLQTGKFYLNNIKNEGDILKTFLNQYNLSSMRLTRNITNFISPAGMEGLFQAAFIAVADCLAKDNFCLSNYLHVYVNETMQIFFDYSKEELQEKTAYYTLAFKYKIENLATQSEKSGKHIQKIPKFENTHKIVNLFMQQEDQSKMSIDYKVWF